MKNILHISLIMIALVVSTSFTARPRPESKEKPCLVFGEEVKNISNNADFPEQIKGVVVVKYYVDENSRVNIREMQSNDARLKAYVFSKLNGKEVCSTVDNNDHLIKINFLDK